MKKILRKIITVKKVKIIILTGVLILVAASAVLAQGLNPAIDIQPGRTVEVGEEVYFSAIGTTFHDEAILEKALYEWDFGDGYSCKWESGIVGTPNYYMKCSGIAVTHYFMKPGNYAVKLKVTIWSGFDKSGYKPLGEPIDVKTTKSIVRVTGEAPLPGFEIQRAPFHNRLAQYLYVQIPAIYRGNQTTLRVTLEETKGINKKLLSKKKLAAEEVVFLDHKSLVQGDYVIIAELIGGSGKRIPGGLWRDKFSKRYDGIPDVGIDENNAFRLKGNLFFPIGVFLINPDKFDKFKSQTHVNHIHTEGYNANHSPESWQNYLNKAAAKGFMAIGPGQGDYFINFAPASKNRWKVNHNTDRIAEYVRMNKNNPAMLIWAWQDEPNLGGWQEKAYLPVVSAWSYVTHKEDPHHPTYNGFVGNDWSKYYGAKSSIYADLYNYMSSDKFMGGKKWTQDIFGFDIYPISSRLHPTLNFTDIGPYAAYLDALNRIYINHKNLIPVTSALQPCQGAKVNPWLSVTNDQVYMEAWMNVIHGVKGILWFPYFDMENSGRWDAMKKFSDEMKALAPVVLQPAPAYTVTDDANVALKRVDTMIREMDNYLYIFAVRVTEPDPVEGAKYQGLEPDSITVNFKISDLFGTLSAEVVDEEGRWLIVNDGCFKDIFTKNAVHIYKITLQ